MKPEPDAEVNTAAKVNAGAKGKSGAKGKTGVTSQGKTVCDLKRCSHVVITYKITCDSVCDHIRKITYGKSHRASHTVNHIR